ncbi:hypothetical protein GBA52_028432 [Prunus armeniaca]|nr:hypothetical protein GBA52_028432 [Prunus armeniaca]
MFVSIRTPTSSILVHTNELGSGVFGNKRRTKPRRATKPTICDDSIGSRIQRHVHDHVMPFPSPAINNMHHHALVQYGGRRLQQQADNHFVTHIIQYLVQKTMTSSSVR